MGDRHHSSADDEAKSSSSESEGSDDETQKHFDSDDDSEASEGPLQEVPLGQRLAYQQYQPHIRARRLAEKQPQGSLPVTATGNGKRKFKRENKNRPREQSSKRPVPRFREVMDLPAKQGKDPRFEDLSGKLQEPVFKKRYAFLYDEQLPEESSHLKKKLKKTKSAAKKQTLKADLTRIQQQVRNEERRRKEEQQRAAAKAKEKEAVKAGKKPFFVKKSEKRRQELIQRYQELKATGKLQKTIEKRRKKNAQKDHRYVPSVRAGTE